MIHSLLLMDKVTFIRNVDVERRGPALYIYYVPIWLCTTTYFIPIYYGLIYERRLKLGSWLMDKTVVANKNYVNM